MSRSPAPSGQPGHTTPGVVRAQAGVLGLTERGHAQARERVGRDVERLDGEIGEQTGGLEVVVTVGPAVASIENRQGADRPDEILPSLDRADQAPRMPVRVHKIDDDVLFDCDLSAQRVALGAAKKST